MHTINNQPYINSRAFNKANTAYVPFPSQADAMIASLQLFHDVPCRIMDLIFSVVTHPDFDSKQVTLRNSIDVIDVVEGSRLKDRMAVIHERSVNRDGCTRLAGFPHFVLHEVLEIIHAKRMDSIRAYFENTLSNEEMYRITMHVQEDEDLKAMSLVHRTWTLPVQKALGRILYIGRPYSSSYHRLDVLQVHPVRKSIFGPWTSVVALQLYHPMKRIKYSEFNYKYSPIPSEGYEYRRWLKTLHRILVSSTNLKSVLVQSYAPYFTEWADSTVRELMRRNMYLEEVALYSARNEGSFFLDPLIENPRISENLRALSIQGAKFSEIAHRKAMQGTNFARLRNLTITRSSNSLEDDLTMLSILSTQSSPYLKSLRIINDTEIEDDSEREDDSEGEYDTGREICFETRIARALTGTQCAAIFKSLCALHIDGKGSTDQWFKWIVPYCLNLKSLSIVDSLDLYEGDIQKSTSQCTAILEHLYSLRIVVSSSANKWMKWMKWIGPHCSNLKSCSVEADVSLSSDVLLLISSTIQSLDLRLKTTTWTELEDITNWTKCLLKEASSKHFSELKSIKLVLSSDCLSHWQMLGYLRADILIKDMHTFKKEMTTACRGAGIECHLSLPLNGLM